MKISKLIERCLCPLQRFVRRKWWFIYGNLVWYTRDWWYENYKWTGVNYDDMPDRHISEWQFWVYYSPINGA